MSTYRQYLKTLRRVPDDVILAVATRKLDLDDGSFCLCGWVVREAIARIRDADAATLHPSSTGATACSNLYGGTEGEWDEIYSGVIDTDGRTDYYTGAPLPNRLPEIERAFVERVLEAVS